MFGISLCCLYRAFLSGYCLQAGLALYTYLYSQTNILTCFGGDHHYHRQGRQSHRPKTPLQKVSILSYTHRYIWCPPSTQSW